MDDYNTLIFWTFVAVSAILIARVVWKELRAHPKKRVDILGPLRRSFIYLVNAGHGAGLP